MKFLRLFLLSTAILLAPAISKVHADEMEDYRISADDQISVSVFNEPDLNLNKVRVTGSGTVSMPLIGQVTVKDLTTAEVEQRIVELLKDGYLKKPSVTVTITEYRPFYINGEVRRPGSYPYVKGLTIEKAVTLAGGFTERASKSTIFMVRENNKQEMKSVALDLKVRPGDVITVSESFF